MQTFLLEEPKALKYLQDARQLKMETIREFELGYLPESLDKTTYEELQSFQIAYPSTPFCNRVLFPIFNAYYDWVGFGGRSCGNAKPKYINTPYSKRMHLYGLQLSAPFIFAENKAFVVEGYFDVISLYQQGIKNVVGMLSLSLAPEQVRLLHRLCENVVLVYDGDQKGLLGWEKRKKELQKLFPDMGLSVVCVPSGQDPDTYVHKVGKEKFLQYIQESLSSTARIKTKLRKVLQ